MKKIAITGSMTAVITPFKKGQVDEHKYIDLIKRQIKNGIEVIVAVGTTGESATLTHAEHELCIKIAVDTCKGSSAKVMAGAGSNATHEAISLSEFAAKAGADAILLVSPYYNKPTQEGLYLHFKAVASSCALPLMLYNVPGRTGSSIDTNTAIRLFRDCPSIYGIKEASGDIDKCVDLLAHEPGLCVLSGEDAISYPILSNGGKGIISVTANLLPNKISALVKEAMDENYKSAKAINDELYEMNKILFCESNPIPIKAAMYVAGLLDSLEYRLPLCAPSSENLKRIETVMKKYEVPGM